MATKFAPGSAVVCRTIGIDLPSRRATIVRGEQGDPGWCVVRFDGQDEDVTVPVRDLHFTYPRTADQWWAQNQRFNEEDEREHGPDTHDCKGEAGCTGDPKCKYAICDTCGAPNNNCQCDAIYERWKDERYDR